MKADWLARARREGAPLLDGARVTWLWQGRAAPTLIGDFNHWDMRRAPRFRRAGPQLWIYSRRFPLDAYMEYAFLRAGRRIRDPFNPRTTPNGLGNRNHYFYMPGAHPTALTRRAPVPAHGEITRHTLEIDLLTATRRRAVWLYRPPAPGPYPLLVVWDGADYLRRAKLANIVDNLLAQRRIRPVALAFVANGGPLRGLEYSCNDLTLAFLTHQLLPFAHRQLPLLDLKRHPGSYGVLGASLGGLMALHTGLRLPRIFGHVLSQSGAFAAFGTTFVTTALVRHGPRRPVKIWMDYGRYEWLRASNRAMHQLLRSKGYAVTCREYNGGHNYPAWRDDLAQGLEMMFGS